MFVEFQAIASGQDDAAEQHEANPGKQERASDDESELLQDQGFISERVVRSGENQASNFKVRSECRAATRYAAGKMLP